MNDGFWIQTTLNTLFVVLSVMFGTSLIALPTAWLIERSDLTGRQLLGSFLTLPYIVPSYLLAVAWITLANPDVGWINIWAHDLFNTQSAVVNIYGRVGIVFVETSALFSILFLSFRASLTRMDPSLEEAARLAGASPARVFVSITLPVLKNSVILGIVGVGLASMASFGVPAMIGGPARQFVLTTGIFSLLKKGTPEGFHEALSVALKMMLVTLGVVVFSKYLASKRASFMSGRIARPSLVTLGRARMPLAIFLWAVWFFWVAMPLGALVFSSFQSDPSRFDGGSLGLQAWKRVLFELSDFHTAVSNSFITAASAAALVLLLSVFLALLRWDATRTRAPWKRFVSRFFEESAFVAYSLPGTLLALLLIVFSSRFSFLRLSDTLWILTLAMVLKYASLSFNTLIPSAMLVHPSLIESAQLSGARFWARFTRIWIPLFRPALIAAALLVFMPCLSELTMSNLLYGPGTQNLGVLLFEQQEYADRASASVIGTMLLATVALLQYGIGRTQRESSV